MDRAMATSTKKKVNRYFNGVETMRLIVTVEREMVELVDQHLSGRHLDGKPHAAAGNRAEFIRLAIAEKLQRDLIEQL